MTPTTSGPDRLPLSPMAATLGLELVEAGEGHAVLRMRVASHLVNGFGITHGAAVFGLADETFALACNDDPGRQQLVAQQCEIDYLRPTREGDELLARAVTTHRGRSSGIYDVTVTTNQDGVEKTVALFRGRCRALPPRA